MERDLAGGPPLRDGHLGELLGPHGQQAVDGERRGPGGDAVVAGLDVALRPLETGDDIQERRRTG